MPYFSEENVQDARRVLNVQPNNFCDLTSSGATYSFLTSKHNMQIDVRSLSYFLKEIGVEKYANNQICSKLDVWARVVRKLGMKEITQSDFLWGFCQAATTNYYDPLLLGEAPALAINALFTNDLAALGLFRNHRETVVRVSAALNEYPGNLLQQ